MTFTCKISRLNPHSAKKVNPRPMQVEFSSNGDVLRLFSLSNGVSLGLFWHPVITREQEGTLIVHAFEEAEECSNRYSRVMLACSEIQGAI